MLELPRFDERVRCAAIEHLPYVEDERAFDVLVHAIKAETPNVRAAAARALGTMDAPEVVQPLIEGLSDEDVWVRYFSARALGRRRSEESVEALGRVIEKERSTTFGLRPLIRWDKSAVNVSPGLLQGWLEMTIPTSHTPRRLYRKSQPAKQA